VALLRNGVADLPAVTVVVLAVADWPELSLLGAAAPPAVLAAATALSSAVGVCCLLVDAADAG
jgi:hypothetical protein